VSTIQHQDVFNRCYALAKELEDEGRLEDSVAVLRALQVYLDIFPAFPYGSCRKMTADRLEQTGAKAREKEKKAKEKKR